MIAFLPSLGFPEMVILVILGLLLYGRNLPEAGRAIGKVAAQFRRGFQEFKDQLDREGDLRDMKKTLQNTAQELKRVAEVPRASVDPSRMLRDLTNEALSSPVPPEQVPQEPSIPSTNPPPPSAIPRSPEPPA